MADVSQNISAQLFVKELPSSQRANYTGCQQDFKSPYLTTCINNVSSDIDVEDAFQKQLNLSEYYKSPEVFNTIKNNYMEKTMEGHFETKVVDLDPSRVPQVSSAPLKIPVGPRDFIQNGIKETFGSTSTFMGMDMKMIILIILIAVIAILLFVFLKKKRS
jgi:hypothetical protein